MFGGKSYNLTKMKMQFNINQKLWLSAVVLWDKKALPTNYAQMKKTNRQVTLGFKCDSN